MFEITTKIKNNAMISYGFFLLNLSFLKSKNPNINNEFVKTHTKTAILIHLGFLANILILLFFNFGNIYNIFGYSFNDIFAISVFLFLFLLLIIGVYKAYNRQTFSIGKTFNFKKDYKILDLTKDGQFNERDKLTFILSLVPFIGYLIYPEFRKNKLIENNIKLNTLITLLIIFLYISGKNDLANLLFLLYLIFITFFSIYAFIQNEIIQINLEKIPKLSELYYYLISFKIYLKNYFTNKKDFMAFKEIFNNIKYKENLRKEELNLFLNKKENFKLNKYFIYIPVFNFITLFNLDTKQKYHIINGVIISSLLIIILIFNYFNILDYKYILFLLFPLFYGIGTLRVNNLYAFSLLEKIFNGKKEG